VLARARAVTVLKVDDAAAAISALATRLDAARLTSDFQDVTAGLRAQVAALNSLLNTRQSAYDLLAAARDHLARAAKAGGVDVSQEGPQLDTAAQGLDAASDLPTMTAAKQAIQAVKNAIDIKYNIAVYGPGKVIVVSIAREELEALQDGVVVLDTIVTTGRPSLPTVVGNFTVMRKYAPYHMVSPWPKGDKYYYPPVWMKWAMLFADGGYFIHDAPWRYHYGPGSDTEYGGTHGCVNVPAASMGWLYDWTPVGTKVATLAGDF
jgi:lipoprotein-anchoring transpeptidase ErfK/SrfK